MFKSISFILSVALTFQLSVLGLSSGDNSDFNECVMCALDSSQWGTHLRSVSLVCVPTREAEVGHR